MFSGISFFVRTMSTLTVRAARPSHHYDHSSSSSSCHTCNTAPHTNCHLHTNAPSGQGRSSLANMCYTIGYIPLHCTSRFHYGLVCIPCSTLTRKDIKLLSNQLSSYTDSYNIIQTHRHTYAHVHVSNCTFDQHESESRFWARREQIVCLIVIHLPWWIFCLFEVGEGCHRTPPTAPRRRANTALQDRYRRQYCDEDPTLHTYKNKTDNYHQLSSLGLGIRFILIECKLKNN